MWNGWHSEQRLHWHKLLHSQSHTVRQE